MPTAKKEIKNVHDLFRWPARDSEGCTMTAGIYFKKTPLHL
jgi:hypothetical protein